MKRRRPDPRATCCWCNKRVPSDDPVYGMGGKALFDVDVSEYRGRHVLVILAGLQRSMYAAIPSTDSQAAKDGWNFYFMTCSEQCCQELRKALKDEPKLQVVLEPIGDR